MRKRLKELISPCRLARIPSPTTKSTSDETHEAEKAFKFNFVVDDEIKAKYLQFGLKVAESNVSEAWELPAPATLVIDREGVVRWAFADWDYRKRADPDEVIKAVKAIGSSK